MALPDFPTQDPATYKAAIDATADDHETRIGDNETTISEHDTKINGISTALTAFPTGSGDISVTHVGIPVGAKRVTVYINDLKFNLGLDTVVMKLGASGGVEVSGYKSIASLITGLNSVRISNEATAYLMMLPGVSQSPEGMFGVITLNLIDESTNTWSYSFMGNTVNGASDQYFGSGKSVLPGALERFSIDLLDSPIGNRFASGSFSVRVEY